MSEKYMGGKGVLKHTDKLIDELWDKVPMAIIGSALWSCCAIFAVIAAVLGEYYIAFALLWPIPVGVLLAKPWHDAKAKLREHRLAMEAETAKYGKGWAVD